jgi:hypothetical protein
MAPTSQSVVGWGPHCKGIFTPVFRTRPRGHCARGTGGRRLVPRCQGTTRCAGFIRRPHEQSRITHASIRAGAPRARPNGWVHGGRATNITGYPATSSIDRKVHPYLLAGDLDTRVPQALPTASGLDDKFEVAPSRSRRHQWRTARHKVLLLAALKFGHGLLLEPRKDRSPGQSGTVACRYGETHRDIIHSVIHSRIHSVIHSPLGKPVDLPGRFVSNIALGRAM